MLYPKFLKEKGIIGAPAPSAGAGTEQYKNSINKAIKYFEDLGYKVNISKNIYNDIRGRSALAEERGQEINETFKNPNIDFIICAFAGDFLVEMLPFVDFDLIKENPKFIAGFSDPTGLLYPITTKYDIATIYGQNLNSFGHDKIFESEEDFFKIIHGNLIEESSYEFYEETPLEKITGTEPSNLTEKVYWKTLDGNEVNVKGRIIGGCFDLIAELAGTKYDGINEFNERYKQDGIIWYFDNCEISMEETIRALWKMNELGYFKYAKCIVFGRFGLETTIYGYDVKTCFEDSVISKLGIPIVYEADFSHKDPCLTVINGSIATLKVKDGKAKLSFELK